MVGDADPPGVRTVFVLVYFDPGDRRRRDGAGHGLRGVSRHRAKLTPEAAEQGLDGGVDGQRGAVKGFPVDAGHGLGEDPGRDLVAGGQEGVEVHLEVERGRALCAGRCAGRRVGRYAGPGGARGVRCLDAGNRPFRDDNAVADQAASVAALEHQPRVRAGGASGRVAGSAVERGPDVPAGQVPAGFGDLFQHGRVGPIVPFVGVPDEDDCCHLPIVAVPGLPAALLSGPVGPVMHVALRVSSAMDSIWCRMWVSPRGSGSGG